MVYWVLASGNWQLGREEGVKKKHVDFVIDLASWNTTMALGLNVVAAASFLGVIISSFSEMVKMEKPIRDLHLRETFA